MDVELKSQTADSNANMTYNANCIALQTMKERCYWLQNRLTSVEKENVQLSIQCSKLKNNNSSSNTTDSLNASIAQLTKEKSHLAHHIFIVACENKKLWSRLSQLTKTDSIDKVKRNSKADSDSTETVEFTAPTLTRSQTFTHCKSDPKLAVKLEEETRDIKNSLEEISLKLINSFLLEKSELVHQYEQMVEMQMNYEKSSNDNSIGFTYSDDYNNESLAALKLQKDKICDLKKIALEQQIELKECLNNLKSFKLDKRECNRCKNQSKNLMGVSPRTERQDTTSSDAGLHDSSTKWATATSMISYNNDILDRLPPSNIPGNNRSDNAQNLSDTNVYFDPPPLFSSQAKKENSQKNPTRICPMCGKYFVHVSFNEFELHVESHFTTENDLESHDENFDLVANSIDLDHYV